MLAPLSVPVFADGIDGHNKVIEYILFGKEHYKEGLDTDSDEYKGIKALEYAVAICVDQYNNSYTEELDDLHDYGVRGIPDSIYGKNGSDRNNGEDGINFHFNQHHRRYTHRGWNFQYIDDKGNWEVRKTILLQTVNKVFGFQWLAGKWWFKDFGYDDQCEAFAEFLYYLHILGEYEDTDVSRSTIIDTINLAREHPMEGNEDIFWELERIFPVIFEKSVGTDSYEGLLQDIKILAQEARSLEANGGITNENLQQYVDIATRLIDKLQRKVPSLLKSEPFFSDVFY